MTTTTFKTSDKVLQSLGDCFIAELKAVRQYTSHAAMQERWGYSKLAAHNREEAREELGHADLFAGRLQLFGADLPTTAMVGVNVGDTVIAQLRSDLEMERTAIARLKDLGTTACEAGDHATFDLAVKVLKDEEGHALWLDKQLQTMAQIGEANWLQTML